jgi:hypothetical protein
VGEGEPGIEPDRLSVVGDGAVEVAQGVRDAPVVVGEGANLCSFVSPLDDERAACNAAVSVSGLCAFVSIELTCGERRSRNGDQQDDRNHRCRKAHCSSHSLRKRLRQVRAGRARRFEPFYTTKSDGSRSIVQEHGGTFVRDPRSLVQACNADFTLPASTADGASKVDAAE